MTRPRLTRDLCQTDWETAHPGEYAPVATREGTCAQCGDFALITRSTIADEVGADAPACDVCKVWGMPHPQGCQRPQPVALTPDEPVTDRALLGMAAAHSSGAHRVLGYRECPDCRAEGMPATALNPGLRQTFGWLLDEVDQTRGSRHIGDAVTILTADRLARYLFNADEARQVLALLAQSEAIATASGGPLTTDTLRIAAGLPVRSTSTMNAPVARGESESN